MNISSSCRNNYSSSRRVDLILLQTFTKLGFRIIAVFLGLMILILSMTTMVVNGEPLPRGQPNNSFNKTLLTGKSIVIEECKAFTNGISTYEFTSPLYPNNYPDNIDCVKLITAEPGHRIQIRIIERFEMEESPGCKYDYLEARNGQFGYSTELVKVCGTIPPTPILGHGRYMWLRFHSDAGINYGGFKALITMVPSSDFTQEIVECAEELKGEEGVFRSDDLMATVPIVDRATTCAWIIETSDDRKISLKFEEYKLEKPNDCGHNFIEVYRTKEDYDGRATEHGAEKGTKKFCGSTADAVKSIQNFLAVRFFAVGFKPDNQRRPQFKANFTVYRELTKDATPPEVCDEEIEFNCGDLTCISLDLKCNHRYNCDLRTDEEKCPSENTTGLTADILVIGLVGVILIFGMCAGMILNIYRKLKQDREELNELKETLKKSREFMAESNRVRIEPAAFGSSPGGLESAETKDIVFEKKSMIYSASSTPALPTSVVPQPSRNIPPNGDLKKSKLKNINTINTVALVSYNPPPSYPTRVSVKSKASAPVAEACTGTDDVPSAPSTTDNDEIIIEVRDVACQTRGLPGSSRDNFGFSRRRAPLAREDAVYEFLPVQRRVRRFAPELTILPSLSSASSETGRSLERLDEVSE